MYAFLSLQVFGETPAIRDHIQLLITFRVKKVPHPVYLVSAGVSSSICNDNFLISLISDIPTLS